MLHTSNNFVDVSESAGPCRTMQDPCERRWFPTTNYCIYILYNYMYGYIYIYLFTGKFKSIEGCSMYLFVRNGVTQSIEDQCLYSWLVLVRGCKLFVLYAYMVQDCKSIANRSTKRWPQSRLQTVSICSFIKPTLGA